MRRALIHTVAVLLALSGFAAARATAQETTSPARQAPAASAQPAKAAPPAAAEGSASSQLRAAIGHQIVAAQEKLVALADAMPAEKYTWRPGEGVRSVGEVYMHVAAGNFYLPTFWGVQAPAGIDLRGLEKQGTDKAKTAATLKQSFEHLRHAIDALSDAELGKSVNFFGRQVTLADLLLQVTAHGHEHLGQAIAYARTNGIAPPWSGPQTGRD